MYMKRRPFVSYSFAVATAGLAGCIDEVTQPGSDGTTEAESQSDEADGPGSDGTTEAESQSDEADGPESMVEEYLEAVAMGDEETVAELRHDSLEIPPETYEVQDYQIHTIEQRSVETVASEVEAPSEEFTSELDSITSEMGVDDYTFVAVDWEIQENDETERISEIVHVVYDDDEWFVGAPLAI